MHIILQTSRLILRRFTDSDADAAFILELNSNAEVLKYLHEPLLQDEGHARTILQTIILPHYQKKPGPPGAALKKTSCSLAGVD